MTISSIPWRIPVREAYLKVASPSIRGASPGISYKLRNKDAIGGRGWNIATQERKICYVEIEIILLLRNWKFVMWKLKFIRYVWACSSNKCFILRARRLSSKLHKQGYLVERLELSLRKFYNRYGDLIQQYEGSLSRILNDILTLDQQWLPSWSDFLPIHDFDTELDLHGIMSVFHGAFGTGVACQQGTLTPSDTWLRPLAYAPIVETLAKLREVYMEHLRRLWHASKESLPFRTSGSAPPPPLLGLVCPQIGESKFYELALALLDFSPWMPLGTFSILLH